MMETLRESKGTRTGHLEKITGRDGDINKKIWGRNGDIQPLSLPPSFC